MKNRRKISSRQANNDKKLLRTRVAYCVRPKDGPIVLYLDQSSNMNDQHIFCSLFSLSLSFYFIFLIIDEN